MLAGESGCVAAVDLLVHRGAELRLLDSLGHDVLHYAKLSGSGEIQAIITAALQHHPSESGTPLRSKTTDCFDFICTANNKANLENKLVVTVGNLLQLLISDKSSPRSQQHEHTAKLNDERSTTPKKRKAPPPPPISPVQVLDAVSPLYVTPNETPVSSKGHKKFNYKEEELRSVSLLREEIEKLQEEKRMLLETIEDLKQIMEQTEPKATASADPGQTERDGNSALLAALQAKVASLSLENQQLAQIIKKRPPPQGEEGQEDSRPNSIDSYTSYHSTHAEFDHSSDQELSDVSAFKQEDVSEPAKAVYEEEITLLREALQSLQVKLDESRLENRSLQARLELSNSHTGESGNEGLSESTAELKAKLVDLEKKYQEVVLELETLRKERVRVTPAGSPSQDDQVVQKFQYLKSCLEQEVKDLRTKLAKLQEEKMQDAQLIKELKSRLESASSQVIEDECEELKNTYRILAENINQEKALLIEKYEEAQDEIKMLQEALRGTVSVEAAAKDFDEMKTEMGGIIEGLQKRLLELSKSYSETKTELAEAQSQLQSKALETKQLSQAVCFTKEQHEDKLQELTIKMKHVQYSLKDAEVKYQSALKEISQLKQDAEIQAKSSVSIADHTQVVASLGNAIKNLESEVDVLKQQLTKKTTQLDALQNRPAVEKVTTPDDCVSKMEHEKMRESLEHKINQLTQHLQDALRKQDEMALEVTAAWQEAKDDKNEKEAAQKLALSREQQNNVLSGKCREAQEAITQLKKQVENHVNSEREKNKKIDDLSKEVGKLKEALNSLSQLSYTTSSPKSRQQNQQVDSLQQQIKQLQYQLAESKKRHHEIVSVYRMHLLYAVQGQMDEDVQKALKQILVMCKIPSEEK
ncbi:hypothetical protein QTP86_021299 [Hemibagrus guttatus]|nr:hypothetical protein QTP86_021299 [Hemibagrus guttatus]